MPETSEPFEPARVLERLHSLLLSSADVQTFLTELSQLATTVSDGPASCGITLRYDANMMTVGSSDERAALLDETQYRTGQGPCLQAVTTGRAVAVTDARTDRRWPAYLPRAVELGLRCSLSLPLDVGDPADESAPVRTIGAMNVYGFERPDIFSGALRRQLELYAAQAAGSLRLATRHMKDATLMTQMEQALSSRTVIDQAIGIIMAQQRCTASAAFELMRRESQNSRRPLRVIAAELVLRTSGEAPDQGAPFVS